MNAPAVSTMLLSRKGRLRPTMVLVSCSPVTVMIAPLNMILKAAAVSKVSQRLVLYVSNVAAGDGTAARDANPSQSAAHRRTARRCGTTGVAPARAGVRRDVNNREQWIEA